MVGGQPSVCPDTYTDEVFELSSQLASFATFGSGCPGSQATPTLQPAPGSLPRIGQTFTLRLGSLPLTPFYIATIPFLGFEITTSGGASLPRDLGFVGMPGCSQYVDPFQTAFVFTATSTADWQIAIPNLAGIAGVHNAFLSRG
jgi:hypothetical protein